MRKEIIFGWPFLSSSCAPASSCLKTASWHDGWPQSANQQARRGRGLRRADGRVDGACEHHAVTWRHSHSSDHKGVAVWTVWTVWTAWTSWLILAVLNRSRTTKATQENAHRARLEHERGSRSYPGAEPGDGDVGAVQRQARERCEPSVRGRARRPLQRGRCRGRTAKARPRQRPEHYRHQQQHRGVQGSPRFGSSITTHVASRNARAQSYRRYLPIYAMVLLLRARAGVTV